VSTLNIPAIAESRLAEILRDTQLTSIPLSSVQGIHCDVPEEMIDSYPTRHDFPRGYSDAAIQWLVAHECIGVIRKGGPRAGKMHVVSGLSTWRLVEAQRIKYATEPETKTASIWADDCHILVQEYPGNLTSNEIRAVSCIDLWLRLAAGHPEPSYSLAVFARVQALCGGVMLKTITPSLKTQQDLADYLNQKSHAAISRLVKKPQRNKPPSLSDTDTTEAELAMQPEPKGDKLA
jgi:hypothetical protein